MEIKTARKEKAMLVELSGRLDALTSTDFETRMRQLMEKGHARFVLDMEAVDYISSAGLRSVLVISKALKAADGRLLLAGLSEPVREVFEMTGFAGILEIYPSAAAAFGQL